MSFKKIAQKSNMSYWFYRHFSGNMITRNLKKTLNIGKFVSLKKVALKGDSTTSNISINKYSVLHDVTIIVNGRNNIIKIGNNVEIAKCEIVISGDDCIIEIGNNCSIHETRLYCGEKNKSLKIGNDCLIGFGCTIMTSDAHYIFDGDGTRINTANDILIGDHVWLASKCTILRGATISSNCVGGANSFIKNKTIPSGSIFVDKGRVTRTGITWIR